VLSPEDGERRAVEESERANREERAGQQAAASDHSGGKCNH